MTNICIFGAGAIGGYLACSLKKTNANVSLIARGTHKKIIKNEGLKLIKNNVEETHKFLVTDTPSNLPVQDYVILAVKAHTITDILDSILPIIGKNTSIISAVNGIPMANQYEEIRRGLDWFMKFNPKAYMVLLD